VAKGPQTRGPVMIIKGKLYGEMSVDYKVDDLTYGQLFDYLKEHPEVHDDPVAVTLCEGEVGSSHMNASQLSNEHPNVGGLQIVVDAREI